MKAWHKSLLGECCEVVGGSTPSTSIDDYWNGDICWVTPKDLSELGSAFISDTPRKLTRAGLKASGAQVLPVGSVLLSSRAPIGHVAINTVPMATNQGFKSLIPKPDVLQTKFLYWWLRTNTASLQRLGRGATFKEVSKSVVERIEIRLPALEEQRRIAEILDRAEELRAKRRAALAQLDTLTQSIFLDLFGDPVSNPKGWPRSTFSEVCESRLGKMVDQKQQTGQHLRYYLRNANVKWFGFDLSDVFQMDFDAKSREVLRLREGDIIICEGGEPGRAAIWRGEIEECYYQKALHRARPRGDVIKPEYVVWLLWFLSKRGGLKDHVTSATIAHLTGVKLKSMAIPIPPIDFQREFTDCVESIENLKSSHGSSLAELGALFASLQHRAFRGEL